MNDELEKLVEEPVFRAKLEKLSLLENQLKTLLAEGFKKAVMKGSSEDLEKMMTAFNKFKEGSSILKKAKQQKSETHKLGSLVIGEQGQKDFGPFRLIWKVQMDHIEWSLNEKEDPQESWLAGVLKYKGWNRIEVDSEISLEQQLADKKRFEDNKWLSSAKPSFRIYVHEWPALKEAMDFLYYELGRKSAVSTYEKSFVKPELLTKEDVNFVVKLAADKVRKMLESETSSQ